MMAVLCRCLIEFIHRICRSAREDLCGMSFWFATTTVLIDRFPGTTLRGHPESPPSALQNPTIRRDRDPAIPGSPEFRLGPVTYP